jgi:hypothetical protein
MEYIEIPKPEFELYQSVFLDMNEQGITQIVSRWYEFDKTQWWYRVKGKEGSFYPECAFSQLTCKLNLLDREN